MLQYRSKAEERASFQGQLENLEKERDSLAAACEGLRGELAAHSEHLHELEDARSLAQASSAEATALRLEAEELRGRCVELEEACAASAAEAKTFSDELGAVRTALSNAELRVAEARAEGSRRARDAEAARQAQEQATSAKTLAEAEVAGLQKKLEAAKALAETARSAASAQRAEVDGLQRKAKELQGELATSRAEAASSSEELTATLSVLAETEKQLKEARSEGSRRAGDVEVARQAQEEATSAKALVEAEVACLQQKLQAATALAETARSSASAQRAEVDEMQRKAEELQRELANRLSSAEVEELRQRVAEAEKSLAIERERLEVAVSSAEERVAASEQDTLEKIRRIERDTDEKISSINTELADLREQRAALQKELAKTFTEASALSAGAETAQSAAAERIRVLEDELQKSQAELSEKRLAIEAQKMAHYDNGREVQQLQDKLQDQAAEIEHLQLRLALSVTSDVAVRDLSEPPTSRPLTPNGSMRLRRGVAAAPALPGAMPLSARQSSSARKLSMGHSSDRPLQREAGNAVPKGGNVLTKRSPREPMQLPRRPHADSTSKQRHATPSTAPTSDAEGCG
jgi:putative ABC transport system permease protein